MSPARRTWFSCVILLGILLDLTLGSIFQPRFPWQMLGAGVALAAVVLAGALWVHGVRGAGRGWRRAVFLLAFAAPMVWLGLGLTDFARGFVEATNEGRRDGQAMAIQDRAAEGLPSKSPRPLPVNPIPKTNPTSELLSWVVLTVLLALILDRLERRQAEAERQTGLAKEAQYRALGARLAPHFIFNTLNTLHAQIEADPNLRRSAGGRSGPGRRGRSRRWFIGERKPPRYRHGPGHPPPAPGKAGGPGDGLGGWSSSRELPVEAGMSGSCLEPQTLLPSKTLFSDAGSFARWLQSCCGPTAASAPRPSGTPKPGRPPRAPGEPFVANPRLS